MRWCRGAAVDGASPEGAGQSEGVWAFATLTPLERPAEFEGKAFVSEAEAAAWGCRSGVNGRMPMTRTDDRLYEYGCHEGNHALEGILRGARYAEKP